MNSKKAYALYKKGTLKPYFIDKSLLLEELFPLVEEGSHSYEEGKVVIPNKELMDKFYMKRFL